MKYAMVVGRAAFLRNSARHSHRLLSRLTINDNRLNYKNARFMYQKAFRSAKNKFFAEFQRVTTAYDFFKALSEFTYKEKTISLPNILFKRNPHF
jgi:hypothetical protein